MDALWQDRVLLLSGATGIAAAAATLAAHAGARVHFVSVGESECAALQQALSTVSAHCSHSCGDLGEAETANRAVAECVQRHGRVDGVFNVAGISGRRFGDGPLHECTDEGFDVTLRVNLRTMFLLNRAALQQMLKQEPGGNGQRGTILNMATVTAYSPQRDYFATHAYAAAKGGVIGMTMAMASYYAPHGIRVNAIAPGLVRTPMSQRAQGNAEITEFMQRKQPLADRFIEADDIARTALFLLSDAARMTTGEVVSVDAGWHVSG